MLAKMFLEAIMVTSACSTDCFVTGFAYGTNKIRIPPASALIINLICTAFLGLSLFLGSVIGRYIPHIVTLTICVTVLCLFGLAKIVNSLIKGLIKRKNGINKEVKFSLLSLKFILHISAKPEEADADGSKSLSITEAAALAVALSFDGIAVGLGAGLTSAGLIGYLTVIGFSLITGFVFLFAGRFIGNKIAKKSPLNLSWLSGLILIALAVIKIFV